MSSPYPGAQPPDDLQPAAPAPAPRPWFKSPRTWIAAGVAAVVVIVGGVVAANALGGGGSSESSANTASQGPGTGGGQGRRGTFGTLQSIDGSTLTVATFAGRNDPTAAAGGTTTVLTNGSTTFYKTASGSFSDIKIGDRITATGTPDGTNSLTAQSITDTAAMGVNGPGPGGGFGNGNGRRFRNGTGNGTPPSLPNGGTLPNANSFAVGTVKSIAGTTLTVADPNGTTKTVNTNGATAISVLKKVSLNDLATGQAVQVRGTTNSDGTVTASQVVEGVGFGRGGFGRFGGEGNTPPTTVSTQ